MSNNSSETLKMDLQFHAEDDPKPDPQPIEPGQQVIDDGDESSKILDAKTATDPGTQKPEPGVQKPDPDKPKATDSSTPAPQYEIDGVQFNSGDVKRWKERDGDSGNEENWKSKLNRRGQELNDRETTLKQRETGMETNQNLLTEYGQFKAVVDANPKAREYFKQIVNDPNSAIQPAIKKIQDNLDARFSALDAKDADIRLTRDFEDYDAAVCDKALEGYNPDNPYDVNKLKYYAWKGINMEAEIQKRIAAGQAQKGPALPPLAAGTPQKRRETYGSPDEAAEAVLRDLGLQ